MTNISNQINNTIKTPPFIQQNIPLNDKNWFRTGGPAKYFYEPTTVDEFAQALTFAKDLNLAIFVLGEGANILISDGGFDGLVIRPMLKEIKIDSLHPSIHFALQNTQDERKKNETSNFVTAGSGVKFQDLINFCLANNLIGLEEFSGIPGTVGGSVFINIHYFEFLLEQFLVSAHVINKDTAEIIEVDNAWFNFGYDQSRLHQDDYYLVDATFKLKKVSDPEAAYAKGRRDEIIRHRVRRYPNAGTCGSFFRNFFDHEVSLKINGKKMIFVAYYLDKLGIKGTLRKGNAIVSHQHANMVVNCGNATSSDIIELTKTMRELVQKEFGIKPQPECQLIGFDPNLLE